MTIAPDFRLLNYKGVPTPNKNDHVTDAEWWLWLRLQELEPKSELSGIYGDKPGFHNTGKRNQSKWPGNYSVRDKINQSGPGMTHGSAIDWTFRDAQGGDYDTIIKYTSRLVKSALDKNDPRLDLILFEFYGQSDHDLQVEGYNEYYEKLVTSDPSHLWHMHMSFIRSKCGDFWGMWALLTVLAGWSVSNWRLSLPATDPNHKPKPKPPTGGTGGGTGTPTKPKPGELKEYTLGTRTLKKGVAPGTDVQYVQRFIGTKYMGLADGIPGPKFEAGVKWYQEMRGIYRHGDGIVSAHGKTWRAMGVK